MADRASRHPHPGARRGARALVVLLGLVLAIAVPAATLAASAPGSAGSDRVAVLDAGTEATPAPDATPKPGEQGSTGTDGGWITSTPAPAESLVPIALGVVVLVILGVLIVVSVTPGESSKA